MIKYVMGLVTLMLSLNCLYAEESQNSFSENEDLAPLSRIETKLVGVALLGPEIIPFIVSQGQGVFSVSAGRVTILDEEALSYNAVTQLFEFGKNGSYKIQYGGSGNEGAIGITIPGFLTPIQQIELTRGSITKNYLVTSNETISTFGLDAIERSRINFAYLLIYFTAES